jgi:hypothetical protein
VIAGCNFLYQRLTVSGENASHPDDTLFRNHLCEQEALQEIDQCLCADLSVQIQDSVGQQGRIKNMEAFQFSQRRGAF